MLRFTRTCAGVLETYIVPAPDRGRLMSAGPTGVALAQAISLWTEAAMKPGARVLCLDCDTVFRPDAAPAAYAISLPFADRGHAIVTGVCASCARAKDLQQVVQQLRRKQRSWRIDKNRRRRRHTSRSRQSPPVRRQCHPQGRVW